MVHNTAKLGGSASNAVVGKVGVSYGCYNGMYLLINLGIVHSMGL